MKGTGQFTGFLVGAVGIILAGCSGSDMREAALIGGGAAGGAAIGNALGHGKKNQALYAAGGGAAGAPRGAGVGGPHPAKGKHKRRSQGRTTDTTTQNLFTHELV
jgi:hypothetical protein